MDDRAELQRFAEMLMLLVRDQAIGDCDALAARKMGGEDGKRWRNLLSHSGARDAVRELIPDIVDQVLFRLLNGLDQGDIPLAWQREDGSYVDLYDLGRSEMAGWLLSRDAAGWRPQHSRQRWS
jgi:hypothetical protein